MPLVLVPGQSCEQAITAAETRDAPLCPTPMNSGPLLPALTVSVIVHASVASWLPPGPSTQDRVDPVMATTIHAELLANAIDAGTTSESSVKETVDAAAPASGTDITEPIAPKHRDAKPMRTTDSRSDFDLIAVVDAHREYEEVEKKTIPSKPKAPTNESNRPASAFPTSTRTSEAPDTGNVKTALLTDDRSGKKRVVGPAHTHDKAQKAVDAKAKSPPHAESVPSANRREVAARHRDSDTKKNVKGTAKIAEQSRENAATTPPSGSTTPPVKVAKNAPIPTAEESGNDSRNLLPQPVSGNPKPRYPRAAVRRGYEGTVELRVAVNSSGAVDRIRVVKGSGYKILDRAAVKAVRRWQFDPALSLGQPVASETDVPVQFLLVDATRR